MNTTAKNTRGRMHTRLLGALIAAVALLALAAPAPALAAPVVQVDSSHAFSTIPPGGYARYALTAKNTGDAATSGDVTIDFTLPAGLRVVSVTDDFAEVSNGTFPAWSCATAPDAQSVSCTGTESTIFVPLEPGEEACSDYFSGPCRIIVMVRADSGATPGVTFTPAVHASGGGSVDFNGTDPIDVGPPAEFELTGFTGDVLDEFDVPETRAGAHPHTAFTEFFFSNALNSAGRVRATEDLKDAIAKIPPGLVGNPQAVSACTADQLSGGSDCPLESQVGTLTLALTSSRDPDEAPSFDSAGTYPVYNMVAPQGTPAVFGFNIEGVSIFVYASVRTGEDYGVTVTSKNAAQTTGFQFDGVRFVFWGVPADPSHDDDRGFSVDGSSCARTSSPDCTNPSDDAADPRALLSLPTSCTGPVETFLDITGWLGGSDGSSFVTAPGGTACPNVPFDASLEARPTTNAGDQPSGLDVELRVTQNDDPDGRAAAHLKDTTVTLPEGLVVNPSGANGLDGCSLSEFGLTSAIGATPIHTTPDAATCPEASKVATVEVNSPLVDHPLRGAAYIADPFQNPFGSLLALYITLDDTQTGVVVKLAGEVKADPNTGRLTTTFEDNPQLPFESFELHFKGGAHGTLRTPAICGSHTTEATLNPWSSTGGASPVDDTDTWSIDQNCSGSAAAMPHAPNFDAGTVSPIAAAHSPFVVHLRREDGSQNFSAVTVSPPQGLVAKLAGTPACSDGALAAAASKTGKAEQANPSCPLASEVGDVSAAAGAGSAPYYAHGKVYLAGPYKGAPLSLATVIPATAGPFDLGTVVTRIAAHVNPRTAEITAVSDQIPHILQGIPLDVRTVDVSLDKPDFVLTGTSCNVMAVNGLLTSTLNQIASLSSRFQLAECTGLGFKPSMSLTLRGGTKRGKHPALTATIVPRPGDANIASVSVAFPRSEFLENAHIRTVCTRPDFAADNCPAGAVYGTSTVDTPLLDYDLTGNVYLRSSDNLLPDVVPDLRGPAHQPIKIEAAGRTDSIRGGIRNTFDFFPDAPFTKATLQMQGGSQGLLVNSRNICAKTYRATVRYTAHNGMTHIARPALRANCRRKAKRGKRRAHRR